MPAGACTSNSTWPMTMPLMSRVMRDSRPPVHQVQVEADCLPVPLTVRSRVA